MKAFLSFLVFLWLSSAGAQAQSPAATAATNTPKASSTAATGIQAKIDPQKEKDIRELLEISGAKERMVTVMSEMEKSIKPMLEQALPPGNYRPKLVDAFFDKFHSKMSLQQLLDLTIPSYDKYFSDEEIKDLIAYYKTPIGQKTITVLPQLLSETMEAGRNWGKEAGRTSMLEVLAEHPEFQQAIADAKGPAPAAQNQ